MSRLMPSELSSTPVTLCHTPSEDCTSYQPHTALIPGGQIALLFSTRWLTTVSERKVTCKTTLGGGDTRVAVSGRGPLTTRFVSPYNCCRAAVGKVGVE